MDGERDLDIERLRERVPRCALVLGKGRSGTSWLAQILNTYEHASYKHEPFLGEKRTLYNQWCRGLESRGAEELRLEFARLCRQCVHGVDQPPFPPKAFRSQNPRILHLLYGIGTRAPPLKGVYEWYGRPRTDARTWALIKEVNFPNERLSRLHEVLRPRLIPIIRNPFANIASHLKGVEMRIFAPRSEADIEKVRKLIDMPGGEVWAEYRDRLGELPIAAFEALRWRIQCEPLVAITQKLGPCHLVVYEDLCADPYAQSAIVFAFLGWEFGESTRIFLKASVAGPRSTSNPRRAFFSVYRSPEESLAKWEKQLSREQVSEIRTVISASPLARLWPGLTGSDA